MIAVLLGAGAIFSLVWAAGIGLSSRPFRDRGTLVLLILLAGLWQASGAIFYFGEGHLGGLLSWHAPLLLLLGPVMYRYYRDTLLERPLAWRQLLPHGLPALLCAVLLLFLGPLSGGENGEASSASAVLSAVLALGPKISIILYLSFLAIQFLRAMWPAPPSPTRTVVLVKLLVIYASLSTGALGILLGLPLLREASAASLPLIMFVSFILAEARPDLLGDLGRQVRRYAKSRIAGLDTEYVRGILERLMREEKAFSDEDITLAGLAREVGISPHQLSEYLNRIQGKNFSDYINDFRVAEAQKLILEERGRTTLSIAHAVGFNSKSAFYRAFRRRTGTDPGGFRRRRDL